MHCGAERVHVSTSWWSLCLRLPAPSPEPTGYNSDKIEVNTRSGLGGTRAHGPPKIRRCVAEKPDHGHHGLLRACRERPGKCRAVEKRDELSPPHVVLPQGSGPRQNSVQNIPHRVMAVWGLGTGSEDENCDQLSAALHAGCGLGAPLRQKAAFRRFCWKNSEVKW